MKTRRKIVKTPSKGGRRSSIICVKKSPLPRKNPRRNTRVLTKSKSRLQTYESPLKSLYFNGSPSTSKVPNSLTTSEVKVPHLVSKDTSVSSPNVKKELKTKNLKQEKEVNIVEMAPFSPIIPKAIESIKKDADTESENDENNEDDNMSIMSVHSNNSTKSKKRSITSIIASGEIPKRKKRKLKKSPLSKINESVDIEPSINNLSDSIIIVDDDSKPATPIKCSTSSVSTLSSNPETKSKTIRLMTKSEDIVIIDCNDSLLTEMEEFHEAMATQKVKPENTNFLDSVIIIDHDDDPPIQPQPSTSKTSEDCFVVWSSLPQPSTSNQNVEMPLLSRPSDRPPLSNNADLLKCDKIMLDAGGQFSNLRLLNNDKTSNIKRTGASAFKKPLLTYNPLGTEKNKKAKSPKSTKTKSTKRTTTTTKLTESTTKVKKTKNNGGLIYTAKPEENENVTKSKKTRKGKLREIVIDGCNVAMAYTNNKSFNEKGIKMLIDYFTKRGHTVKVFVPQHKRAIRHPMLEKWYNEGIVVFTPSRKLGNKNFTPYDDRYILEYATACKGIVVSQDQFRDLYNEKPQYHDTIENRLLVPTFVGDYVMFPEDPLGRNGPNLDTFLKH